ncbi:TonB-dependent receptor [Sphingobacterium lactis]|uniref:TonB-dependent receptor n=1 Tax=Sphingobacterium lactis TaxID=797291 RepID=UPI003DA51D4B
MRKLVFTSIFLLVSLFTFAQHQLAGTVKDSVTNRPVEFASIALLLEDQSIYDGMVTDSLGRFSFQNVKKGSYRLRVKFIGYKQKDINIEVVGSREIRVEDIHIAPTSNQITAIDVTGQASSQTHRNDRQAYRADQYKNAVGGTALDVVKNLPSAFVDALGNISMRGNEGIIVLINGKPSLLDPATLLSQIAANDVTEVEYITTPTAQYDPDGKGGIINLKTKATKSDGFAWILNLQGGLPPIDDYDNAKKQHRYGADIAFQYRKDKLELNGSANYLRNDNAGFRDGDVWTILNDKQTFFPSKGERSFDKYNYGIRLNGNYTINSNNSLSLGVLASKKFQDRVADIHYENRTIDRNSGNLISSLNYFNPNLQNKQGEFYLFDFNYNLKLNDRHRFNVGAIYEYAQIHGSTKNANIENGKDTVQWTHNTYENPLRGLRLSATHIWNLNQAELQTGYQLRHDQQEGNFEYYAAEQGQPSAIVPEFTGKLNATNRVHAFFSQYDRKFKTSQFGIGLRYEYYERDVKLLHTGEEYPYSIHQLYPSVNFMQEFGHGWSWKIAGSRRVQRNNNFELNPIPEREHSETLEQGDPELLPEFITNVETGVVKKLNKGNVFINAYYQHAKNPIQRVNSVYADTILHRVFTNADYAERWGIEGGADGHIRPWLKGNIGANLYNYKISGQVLDYKEIRSNQDWVYSINAGLQATIAKKWSTGLQINYLSERPTVQGWDSRFVTPHFNVSRTFWNGAMTAQLQWQNIELGNWGVNEQRITTQAADFYTTTNYIYEKNILLVNLNFNLQRLNQILKLPKSEFGEKEF